MDKSFGAVVYREEKKKLQYLLIESACSGYRDIPKGHPEGGETPEETALREVLEETNYHIRLNPDFSEAIQYVLPRGEEKRVVFYLGKAVKKGNSRINPREIRSAMWFDYADSNKTKS